jgi:hypothetical protein
MLNLYRPYIDRRWFDLIIKYYFMKNFIFAFLLFSIGCSPIVTLHPLSENKNDYIFKKELMGEWKETKESKSSIFIDTVTSENGPVYHIFIQDNGGMNIGKKDFDNKFWFFAKLIKLNNDYFLDTWFDVNHLNVDTTNNTYLNNEEIEYDPLLYPGHHILHLQFTNSNQLNYSILNGKKILKLLNEKKINFNYTTMKTVSNSNDETIILVDKSKRLQEFVKQSLKLGLFVTDKENLIKVSEERIYTVYESEPYIKPYKKQ